VRRDQCPVTIKLQEKTLRLLFRSKDLSIVKSYLCKQWGKIHKGGDALSVKDFTFSKEVKLGGYSPDCSPPPGAIVAYLAGNVHIV
jgi:DNA polymerase zeta